MGITKQVALKHNAYFVGQVADIEVKNTISKVNGTEAVIPFGVAVAYDGEEGIKAVTTSTTSAQVCGITVREYQNVTLPNEQFGVNPQATATVLTMGAIAVVAGADVQAGDAVFVGLGADVAGKFTKVAGSGATLAVALAGAKFRHSAKAGEVVVIALNLGA